MYSLPDEQNKLLKEMGDLDAQERAGILPVRNNLNLFLLFFTWVIGIVAVALNLLGQRGDGIQTILVFVLIASASLSLAYYNKKFGYYLSIVVYMALAGYVTYTSNFQNTPVVILLGALTVFVFANQFGRSGFTMGLILGTLKALSIFFFASEKREYEVLIAEIINMFSIGIIPVLMLSISKVSRKAKKAEIRAEILALQNQDLLSSWGSMFEQPQPLANPIQQVSEQILIPPQTVKTPIQTL